MSGTFWDKIKKLGLEASLLKGVAYEKVVGEEYITKQKQTIKGKGDVIVYQPVVNIIALEGTPEVLERAAILFGADAGFVRKDLLLPEHAMASPRKEARRLIREFRAFIPPDDYRALIAAEAVCNLEDRGMSKPARALHISLERKYGERGGRIYNLYRSGFIQDFFILKLRYTRYESPNDINAARLFGAFWNDQLEFFERAVWTNEMMTPDRVVEETKQRFSGRGVRRVNVYARGREGIAKIREAVDALLENDPNFRKMEESYPIAKTPCLCIILEKMTPRRRSR